MENSWEPLWKKWRRNEWRGWAWFIAIVGPPLSIVAVLVGATSIPYGVAVLAQSVFAVLYLIRRASWVVAAIASGVWLAWVALTIAARLLVFISAMNAYERDAWDVFQIIFRLAGSLAGSLVWAGLALSYFWRATFGDDTKAPSA